MKKIKVLILLTFVIQLAFGQQIKKASIKTIYIKLNTYTDSLFQHSVIFNECTSGYLFVRFAIDKSSHVFNIQTNKSAPVFLDSIFRQALVHTNGLWQTKKTNNVYLLPVYYNLNSGCKIDTSSKKLSTLEWELRQLPDLNSITNGRQSNIVQNFLDMTDFEEKKENSNDKKYRMINCILLTPYQLVNPVIKEKW